MMVRRVEGESMLPALRPGNIVVARKRVAKTGDIVIARMNGREVIKRVAEIKSDTSIFLVGDNQAHSTDSRMLGTVKDSDILGISFMKIKFAKETPAPAPLRKDLVWISYTLAAVTVAMLLSQLLTFEKFVPLLGNYFMPGGDNTVKVTAAIIVLTELFALPFWLQMTLSPLARKASLVSGFVFTIVWFLLAIWALTNGVALDNSGRFSSLIILPFGWWIVIENLLLLSIVVLVAYILNVPKVFRSRRQ